jgi:hypothetical protein
MTQDRLTNPIWAALNSAQAHLALGGGAAKCFPSDVAPFCAVAEDGMPLVAADLEPLLEDTYFLGAIPTVPPGWRMVQLSPVLQMVYTGGPVAAPDSAGVALLAADDRAMQELTALAFPGYFRARTGILGKYLGIHDAGSANARARGLYDALGFSATRELRHTKLLSPPR